MTMKYTLAELFNKEKIVLAPEIYDCASANAVEMCGFKSSVLSGAELSYSLLGFSDMGLLSFDEIRWATERICRIHSLPMVVDAEDGYGEPLNAYYTCKKIAEAGAAGIIIVDSPRTRIGGTLPISEAVMKYKACAAALKGTDCILVARTDAKDVDEAISRCQKYRKAGADMTLMLGMNGVPVSDKPLVVKELAKKDPGWKWYPDLGSHNGKSDVSLDEIAAYGFNYVGAHYLIGSAMYYMMDAGMGNFQRQDNTYASEKYMRENGLGKDSASRDWYELEKNWTTNPDLIERWPYNGFRPRH